MMVILPGGMREKAVRETGLGRWKKKKEYRKGGFLRSSFFILRFKESLPKSLVDYVGSTR